MVNPLPRIFVSALTPRIKIEGKQAQHILKSLRLTLGDKLELFDGTGAVAVGVIAETNKREPNLVVDFVEQLQSAQSQDLTTTHISLCVGMPKGPRADWLVEKAVEMGASEIVPLISERSIEFSENKVDRWRRITIEACKQSQQAQVPHVCEPTPFRELVESKLKGRQAFYCQAQAKETALEVLLRAKESLSSGAQQSPPAQNSRLLFVVGPEGDFSPQESEMMVTAGAVGLGLGPRRLRTETAALTILTLARSLFPT